MKTYLVTHEHKYGATNYLVQAEDAVVGKKNFQDKIIKAWQINFEEGNEEFLNWMVIDTDDIPVIK